MKAVRSANFDQSLDWKTKRTVSSSDLVDLSWRDTFWLVLESENVCGVKMTMSK